MIHSSSRIERCNLMARPVLEAAAVAQPVSFSAQRAIRCLDALLTGEANAVGMSGSMDAMQWCRFRQALDEHPEAYGSFVVALSHGSDGQKHLVDALAPRAS